ncbi:hypothetical protein ONZ43_g6948 [Nemania bipapillata]|uniref:Uncharacterized protein n=1 Tax=Nemania bipapillata TaxID=110536 RepID=A0ACC2HW95_9PEZI|nr:hypothetical protein ONZ43_g6948 [Nemania bipapillata]
MASDEEIGMKSALDAGKYEAQSSQETSGILSHLCRIEANLDAKFGVESEAIDRKLPEDRRPVRWHEELSMAFLWASATMNTSCFATGFLGWEFGLSLKQAIVISIFASILGSALPGFAATFGAATGLRQISVSRYSFGSAGPPCPASPAGSP